MDRGGDGGAGKGEDDIHSLVDREIIWRAGPEKWKGTSPFPPKKFTFFPGVSCGKSFQEQQGYGTILL